MDLVTARRLARRTGGSSVDDDAFPLGGGLNLVDSTLSIAPGELLAVKNYEPAANGVGYRRIRGFERYANGFLPSEGRYTILNYHRATLVPQIDNAIVGSTSLASGQVIAVIQSKPISVINLAPRSQEFDQGAVWTLDGVTVGASNIANPIDGALNAFFLSETTANTEHCARMTLVKPSVAKTYWVSYYVKPHGTVAAAIRAFNNVSFAQALFHFDSGAADPVIQNGDFLGLGQYMLQLADGWWRVAVKVVSNVQPSMSSQVMCSTPGGELSYVGAPINGLEVFGHQIEETTVDSIQPGEYVQTDGIARGNGEGQLALMQLLTLTGDYVDAENLHVEGVVHAESDGASSIGNADTDELDSQYRAASREKSRAHAVEVPGSGPVRGVAIYNGRVYALRDNAGATAGVLYRANDGTGWTAVPLGFKQRFTAGVIDGINVGDTITGFSSAATGVVRRVVVQTGSFDTNDAVGYIVCTSITGAFQHGEQLRRGSTPVATANGTQFAQTLAPGGRLETRVHNFFGHSSTDRLYGVDGKNPAFEYQDDVFFHQIESGMVVDNPTHLAIHHNQLWMSFTGGSVQRSAIGDPGVWSVSLGAAEIAVGGEVTGFLEEIGDNLFVFTRNRTHYVIGDQTNELLKPFSETGAHEWTIQNIGQGVYLDDRGLTSLTATQRHGNFATNSFSARIEPLVNELRKIGAVASCVVKEKNLYRVFFNDGRFISVGISGAKVTGMTSGDLGIKVSCVDSGENSTGAELIVFGSDTNGYVYRMESGPSFDGAVIQAFFRTSFHHSKSPQRRKQYRRASFHVEAQGPCSLSVGTDYSFADPNEAVANIRNLSMSGGGGIWNVSQWNEFRWSTGVIADASVKLDASGTNIGFLISHEADDEDEHTVSSIMLSRSPRRRHRGVSHG